MTVPHQVLVAEDEELIRDLVCCELRDAGFAVVEAASGHHALRLIAGGAPLHALFTDIRLGQGPDGWEVADTFGQAYPGAPIIYASGFVPGPRRDRPGSLFFAKPYQPMAICDALQRLLVPSL
jgi:CheY-like chemotaxis protein